MTTARTQVELQRAARLVGGARELVVLTGAGISAPSGLPVFRGAGGMWEDEDLAAAHHVDALPGSLPLLWSVWGPMRRAVLGARPNPAHFALSALGRHPGRRVTVVTQNVDELHQRAGSASVAEVHGNLLHSTCLGCGTTYRDEEVPDPTEGPVPTSPCCGAPARPAVILFGEGLPPAAERTAKVACRTAEVLLVVGTSGAVSSATGLVRYARDHGAVPVIVNTEPWPDEAGFAASVVGPAEEVLPALVGMIG